MPRVEIRNLSEEDIEELDKQVKELGLSSRADYIRLVIKLNTSTGIIKHLKDGIEKSK